jgi:hypothetical protein
MHPWAAHTNHAEKEQIMEYEQMKSSPGPWKLSDHFSDGKHDGHVISDVNGWHVCRIHHNIFTVPDRSEQEDANVSLIASAPELLNACRLALLDLEELCKITGNDITATLSWEALNKVIAEGEGRVNDYV